MNYPEALAYLQQASGAKMGLERVRELADRLGNPQKQLKVIHIAGTNGKGSVGAMLTQILSKAGYRTGHFASPALCSVKNYFRINQKEISESTLADIMTEVAFHAEQMTDKPTEFELLAVMAYFYFAKQSCDIGVIECCMGGDTDCTNIIRKPLLSVITNIQKDHCAYLGDTLAEIARHKAGIIKYNCPVLTGVTVPEAMQIIEAKAYDAHAELYQKRIHLESISCTLNGTDFECEDFGKLHLSLLGLYQIENVGLVLEAVKILRKQGIRISDNAVRNGLANCQWQGRFAFLRKENPRIFFDGAHNLDSIQYLQKNIWHYCFEEKCILVLGVMADKDYVFYADILKSVTAKAIMIRPDNARALAPAILSDLFQKQGIPSQSFDSVAEGISHAVVMAQNENYDLIIAGSLYLYREVYQILHDKNFHTA